MLSVRTFLLSSAPAIRSFSTSTARATFAKVEIIGRLGVDPEVVTTKDGKEYMKYTVGTSYKYKNEDKVSWFRIVAFDTVDFLKTLKKGCV